MVEWGVRCRDRVINNSDFVVTVIEGLCLAQSPSLSIHIQYQNPECRQTLPLIRTALGLIELTFNTKKDIPTDSASSVCFKALLKNDLRIRKVEDFEVMRMKGVKFSVSE